MTGFEQMFVLPSVDNSLLGTRAVMLSFAVTACLCRIAPQVETIRFTLMRNEQQGSFLKADFRNVADEDVYIRPAGAALLLIARSLRFE